MDRRQWKTRRAIYAALETLLARESYSDLTVAQIIDEADIGRSTFYAHFETKDSLLSEMCSEMFDHVFAGVNEHCETHLQLTTPDLEGRLAHLLYHLRDNNGPVCGKLLREGEPLFTAYFRAQLFGLIEHDLPARPAGMSKQLQTNMLVSAFCEAVAWWFDNNCPCTPDELAHWFVSCWT